LLSISLRNTRLQDIGLAIRWVKHSTIDEKSSGGSPMRERKA